MEPIEDYRFNHDTLGEVLGRFEIPETFLRVLEKMHPEINKIEVKSIHSNGVISPKTFELIERFRVNIAIQIARKKFVVGNLVTYSEKITNLFRFTYCDYEFIDFNVIELLHEPDITNRDKFMELFCRNSETDL